MYIDDINGAKAKPLYAGIAKDILSNKDIAGSSPVLEKVDYNL